MVQTWATKNHPEDTEILLYFLSVYFVTEHLNICTNGLINKLNNYPKYPEIFLSGQFVILDVKA